MRPIQLIFVAVILPWVLSAQHYLPLESKDGVSFTIKNFGATITGTFQGLRGIIIFDTNHLENSLFDVSVDVSTIDTGINLRDTHLRKKDFFDAENFPTISLTSTLVHSGKISGEFIASAMLLLKGKRKEIAFPFYTKTEAGEIIMLHGSFKINRRDFDIGGWSVSLSDEVVVLMRVPVKILNSTD